MENMNGVCNLGHLKMEFNKTEKKLVDVDEMNGEFILLINSDAYYEDLDAIKERIMEHIENDGDIRDCSIGLYNSLKGVDIERKRNVTVEMDNNEYSEEEEKFLIRDGRNNRVIDEFDYEDEALEKLAELIAEEDGREDLFNLERKVEFTCTYNVDQEDDIKIDIPMQEIEILVTEPKEKKAPSEMTNEEIGEELLEMYKRLGELIAEKDNRKFKGEF